MRYAVIGTGWIAGSYIEGADIAGNWELAAVCSRRRETGLAFGQKYGVEKVFTSVEELAASDCKGVIFTYMWAFDMQSDWDYIEHVMDIFRPAGAEFYFAELVASQEVRLARNRTENRLAHKPSKRDAALSDARLLHEDSSHRLVSHEGEIPYGHYLRSDNTDLSAAAAAERIIAEFGL